MGALGTVSEGNPQDYRLSLGRDTEASEEGKKQVALASRDIGSWKSVMLGSGA